MYEETKRFSFDWKGFLIKLAFIILVLIVVVKLLPINNSNENSGNEFKNNLATLKDAGSSYFTKDRLPKVVGEKIKVTLGTLIATGGVKELIDEKGDSCDKTASYIEVTKSNNGYDLEVYLACGKDSESSYIFLGCMDACNTTTTTTTKKSTTTTTKKQTQVTNKPNTTHSTTKKVTTKAPLKYSVIFNTNGGTLINHQYILAGSKASKPINPSRVGYTFMGWYDNQGNLYDFNTPVNANIVLKAKWLSQNQLGIY